MVAVACSLAGAATLGAAAPPPWAFRPVTSPRVPAVREVGWGQDAIDQFVLARLEQSGLRPAKPADRLTLIRRASFDLTGLPPSGSEIEVFLADKSPQAFARLADRLLASPHFGERWARHWLEVVGYADLEQTRAGVSAVNENAWRYRDYVVGAFNQDRPYDQFIVEQLAGDLLPSADDAVARERLIATGFLIVGLKMPAERRRDRVIFGVADQQVELVTRAFLGLTVAEARTGDHKADPISMRDYYALAGIFTSTESLAPAAERGRPAGPQWLECSLATKEQLIEQSEFESRFEELKLQLREARELQAAFPGEIDSTALEGLVVDNLAAEVQGAWKESSYSTNFVDRNYLHDGNADKGKKSARFVPDVPEDGLYEVLISYTPRANRATNVPVTVRSKAGTNLVLLNQTLQPPVDKVFAPIGKFRFGTGTNGWVSISNAGTKGFVVIDAVRLVPAEAAESRAAQEPDASSETALMNYWQLEKEVREFWSKRPVIPQALAVREGQIRDARLRVGGNPDKLGPIVPRGFLEAVGTPPSTLYIITDESSGRLELANWIARPDNPLTARVAVNRIWRHLFGEGLVRTLDDFGRRGEPPTHPELLDHLAQRFMENGWSVKALIRAIMLSSAYQQSTVATQVPAQDSSNRLLWRMNPKPIGPGELRDALLALSGQLDQSLGGPWTSTNQAAFGTPALNVRRVSELSRRRTLYLPAIRGRESPVLQGLELGDPRASREASQPGSASAADSRMAERYVATRLTAWADALSQASSPDTGQQVTAVYRRALGRDPTSSELAQAKIGLSAAQSSGWESLCRAFFSSAEFRRVD